MNVTFAPVEGIPAGLASSLAAFSPYTSPDFLAIVGRELGRAGYYIASIDKGPIGAMPVVVRGRGFLTRLQALVDGLPAPVWIAPEFQSQRKEISVELIAAIGEHRYLRSNVTDFSNEISAPSGVTHEQVTTLVELCATNAEYPPDKTLRSEIAKTTRDGVTVAPLNRIRHQSHFIDLMIHTESRHGRTPKYSGRFWSEFAELCERDSRFAIWCVEVHDGLASAHVFIVDRDVALNWQIYFDKKFSLLKPNQAITAFAIGRFRNAGVKFLNLGATPTDAAGVTAYKEKWGGSEYRYRTFEFRSWLGRLLP